MTDNALSLEITCPFCKAVGNIKVPASIFSNKKWGVVKIQVPAGAICKEHQFIALIDVNGKIKGYERIEYVQPLENIQKKNSVHTNIMDEFKKYFGKSVFIYFLHSKIFNYPIFIVRNHKNKTFENHIDSLFNVFFPDDFLSSLIQITFIEKLDINKVKNEVDDALILESSKEIVQIPWKEKLKFEENIIKKAFEMLVIKEQLVIIQQEINKFIIAAEKAKGILDLYYDISRTDFVDRIQKETGNKKITSKDLALFKLYIDNRYSPHYWDKIHNLIESKLK